ncbi:EamA-like transporter family [Carnimonas sp. LMG 33810]
MHDNAARSLFWSAETDWVTMAEQACRLRVIAPDAVHSGFLTRRSYVVSGSQSRNPARSRSKSLSYIIFLALIDFHWGLGAGTFLFLMAAFPTGDHGGCWGA